MIDTNFPGYSPEWVKAFNSLPGKSLEDKTDEIRDREEDERRSDLRARETLSLQESAR
jgi:hypothetical protein